MILFAIQRTFHDREKRDAKGRLRRSWRQPMFQGVAFVDGRRFVGKMLPDEHAARLAMRRHLEEQFPGRKAKEGA